MGKPKRRVVLVPEGLWRALKALLAGRGETVSGWFRKAAQEEVEKGGAREYSAESD